MKKFVYYIGCAFLIFNAAAAVGNELAPAAENRAGTGGGGGTPGFAAANQNAEAESALDAGGEGAVYRVRDFTAAEDESALDAGGEEAAESEPRALVEANNEFFKLILMPFIVDKLYAGNKINGDITGFLALAYPKADEGKLERLAAAIKWVVGWKRKYDYAKAKLKRQVRAAALLPKDAPIVAEDGEFAPENPDERKKSPAGMYQVRYNPYKYLEYDKGELGEPVRRRDKNYVPQDFNADELMLALLELDAAAFYRAWQKLPAYDDGSAEKAFDLPGGGKARLVLGLSQPGDERQIFGAIDIILPEGMYINGDYLNRQARPAFVLEEEKNGGAENIRSYELFYPLAAGVEKNGAARRILTGRVRFPIVFERADTGKAMKIAGKFVFELCSADGACQKAAVPHELALKASEKKEVSLYFNYVSQGVGLLPKQQSAHARAERVSYDPERRELTVRFATARKFSNMAAMAEDAAGTNFTNPRYRLGDGWAEAAFDAAGGSFAAGGEVAVSAAFDDREFLRATMAVPAAGMGNKSGGTAPAGAFWLKAFGFGLLLNLMPGIFYLFLQFGRLLAAAEQRRRLWARYALGLALGLGAFGAAGYGKLAGAAYGNILLLAAAGGVAVSAAVAAFGYMNFALFCPGRKVCAPAAAAGIFSVLLAAAFPMFLKEEILSIGFNSGVQTLVFTLFSVWLGMAALPLALGLAGRWALFLAAAFKRFNGFYSAAYAGGILWLAYSGFGIGAALGLAFWFGGLGLLWYLYPQALAETVKHARSKARQQELFLKVERHWLAILLVWTAMAAAGLALAQERAASAMPYEAARAEAAANLAAGKPVLVAVEADYSPQSLFNRLALRELEQGGLRVIRLRAAPDGENVRKWLEAFGRRRLPLSILFTARHPNGLALPENLGDVDFKQALKGWFEPAARLGGGGVKKMGETYQDKGEKNEKHD